MALPAITVAPTSPPPAVASATASAQSDSAQQGFAAVLHQRIEQTSTRAEDSAKDSDERNPSNKKPGLSTSQQAPAATRATGPAKAPAQADGQAVTQTVTQTPAGPPASPAPPNAATDAALLATAQAAQGTQAPTSGNDPAPDAVSRGPAASAAAVADAASRRTATTQGAEDTDETALAAPSAVSQADPGAGVETEQPGTAFSSALRLAKQVAPQEAATATRACGAAEASAPSAATAAPGDPAQAAGHATMPASDATQAAAALSASAAPSPASAALPIASASVPYPVGSDAWRSDLVNHVVYFTQQNLQMAQLHLNPAHLGPLEVHIRIEDNQTTLAFGAAHEATRSAVEQSLSQLRQSFHASGMSLGQTTVGDQPRGFAGSQSQTQSAAERDSGARAHAVSAPATTAAAALAPLRLVDTFA